MYFIVNPCSYKTGANTKQEKYLYLFSCKYKTGIDVLWPGAISCQTVLTAPINDPNPPFMDKYKNKNQRRGTDFSFICVLLVFLLVLLVFLDLSADLESKLMTINNLQLIQYNPHNNWVTKCTFNTESVQA